MNRRPAAARRPKRKTASARAPRPRPSRFGPSARPRRRWGRAHWRASGHWRILVGALVILAVALAVNGVYQVVRKPSELFFPVSGALYKTPTETWRQYAPLFNTYATKVITPDFLAAIAQVEGSGNPVVRTYWRWSWTSHPFEIYRPASSAVGMYQITDGTFAEARHYCVRHHAFGEVGPWNDVQSCWFNSLYARVIPADAIELTSAYLDRMVALTLKQHRMTSATLQHKQDLAAVIHLCGAGAGNSYARRGFRLIEGQRCGDHDARLYLARVKAMKAEFDRLAVLTSDSERRGRQS